MATTKISDVIVPSHFNAYTIERTAELSELISSGVIDDSNEFSMLTDKGGQTINMPFWNDLSGADEVLDDSTDLTPGKIAAQQDVAVCCNRGKAWEANDLAGLLAGDDPVEAITNLVADYWQRRLQAQTLSLLKGVFSIASMAGNLLEIHETGGGGLDDTNYLTGHTFVDGAQKLGDAKERLTAVIMHSAVEAHLIKRELIDFLPDSEGKLSIKVFQGKRVIIDDGMPVDVVNGFPVYTTYIFGKGALALGYSASAANEVHEGMTGDSNWGTEFYRKTLSGVSGLANRKRMVLHPRGIKWLGAAMVKSSPSNAELEDATNWLRVYEQKHIRIVKMRHNIAA